MGTYPPKHVQLCSTRNWESLDLVIGVDDSYVGFVATVGDCGRLQLFMVIPCYSQRKFLVAIILNSSCFLLDLHLRARSCFRVPQKC